MYSIDIYEIHGNKYTNVLYTTINIKDINQSVEIDDFCEKENLYIVNDTILACQFSKKYKYWIK